MRRWMPSDRRTFFVCSQASRSSPSEKKHASESVKDLSLVLTPLLPSLYGKVDAAEGETLLNVMFESSGAPTARNAVARKTKTIHVINVLKAMAVVGVSVGEVGDIRQMSLQLVALGVKIFLEVSYRRLLKVRSVCV